MVRLGPITKHCRAFLNGRNNVGTTHVTAGYSGIVIREYPGMGLKPVYKLKPMAYRDELRLYYPKYYRMTRRDNIRSHPAFQTSDKPFVLVGELLGRCEDGRIARRTCTFTKVSFVLEDIIFSIREKRSERASRNRKLTIYSRCQLLVV